MDAQAEVVIAPRAHQPANRSALALRHGARSRLKPAHALGSHVLTCSMAATVGQAAQAWARSDTRRLLHVVCRVGELDMTVAYYKQHFGMQVHSSLPSCVSRECPRKPR